MLLEFQATIQALRQSHCSYIWFIFYQLDFLQEDCYPKIAVGLPSSVRLRPGNFRSHGQGTVFFGGLPHPLPVRLRDLEHATHKKIAATGSFPVAAVKREFK